MYTIILNPRYNKLLRAISLTVLSAFILSINACMTYSTEDMTPQQFEKLKEPSEQTVIELYTKDTILNTLESKVEYFKGNTNIPSKFKFEMIDSIPAKDISSKAFRLQKKKYEILLADLEVIRTMEIKINIGETLMWTGIISGIIIIAYALIIRLSPDLDAGILGAGAYLLK